MKSFLKQNTRVSWLALLLILSVTVFVACNKQENVQPSPDLPVTGNESGASNEQVIFDPSNPKNPEDAFGKRHNEGLDYIKQRASTDNAAPTLENVLRYANEYATELGETPSDDLGDMETTFADSENFYKNTIANSAYSPKTKGYMYKLMDIFSKTSAQTSIDEANVNKQIVDLEAEVMANKSLTKTESTTLLRAFSVARYSLHYWKRYARAFRYVTIIIIRVVITDVIGVYTTISYNYYNFYYYRPIVYSGYIAIIRINLRWWWWR